MTYGTAAQMTADALDRTARRDGDRGGLGIGTLR